MNDSTQIVLLIYRWPVVWSAGDAVNLFLNRNWRNVAVDLQPLLESKIAELLKKFSNNIYHRFTLDQLLPP